MDRRRDRVVFVAHCILDQATRAWWGEGGARRERWMLRGVVEVLLRHGVGAIQMECPEFSLYGNPRPPRSKDGYEEPEFKGRCREIAEQTCDAVDRLRRLGRDPEIEVAAIVGVEGSPSCGVSTVPRTVGGEVVELPGRGHLMEALEAEMRRRGVEIPMVGVRLGTGEEGLKRLEDLCSKPRRAREPSASTR
ncbi:MAG: hypothetical protein ACE5OO_06030 [Candidatus Bathyarchaeia archaeon]